ncbi:ATP synthase subunit s, mitochondrial-like isoform X2 [Polyodon spathula]|uniref:ATP synthase subunit s, mitochondrial-like isoform X1 n=1 Tax=Polyodon spathula TaxID=7913 RepID=UPI001B7EB7EE|nr:ATP synthase subunit s, mitochondrial-like isoform X1 [Polyodon spathula]XP_041121214.1 ATP synthase subunit s, mitochondrial-like isoform X2 [Polyodon spathula]XP_041121215.1 ATP synthase subunit s, mitochondrial-like isoform X2 [Polyodon spathula]
MKLLVKTAQTLLSVQKASLPSGCRHFWGWLNAVFNKVDYERIKAVGPDRAASEWLLRCGAKVRFQGFDRWQHDYNGLPTGPISRYKIQAIDATESCIMYRGFDHLDGLEHVEEMKLCKCIYIEDACLERLSKVEKLQESLLRMELVSCGNVTDRGLLALHHLRNLERLLLSDLPGVREKDKTVQMLRTALPNLDVELDLD